MYMTHQEKAEKKERTQTYIHTRIITENRQSTRLERPIPLPYSTPPSRAEEDRCPLPEELDPQDEQNQEYKHEHDPSCDDALLVHPAIKE